ncbi:GntR family transcriptional regulator [Marinobacterium zhoushanense]|uniref:GntR family transcriptional regulator n=1 Tax=Marinobacterium zhoushanense TaxID=1679163 RepID=A0ABQ1K4X9_9GAMM|nr:FadR/GntR family transcriptional regulator [Marinobacterium zhoushanense]GGB83472.1 GntR family transcriptional regulator [Marinobacterium zhoushanense]
MEFNPVSQQNLPRQIADQIRAAIADGTLNADDRLPTEEELAKRFQVSRPTIREALKRLAAQNLVRSRRGPTGGTFINRPDISELGEGLSSATRLLVGLNSLSLEEIVQCRLELEQLCATLAAENRSADDLRRLKAALAAQKGLCDQPEQFCLADVEFHRALADAAGNRLLSLLMHAVIEGLQPVSNMVVFRYPERDLIINQHQALCDAIAAGNASMARELIHSQVDTLSAQLERARDESRVAGR